MLENARVANENKKAYLTDEEVQEAISAIEKEMEGNGRVLIRPSGTEPLVRVMIEGAILKEFDKLAVELSDLISKNLGKK